MEVTGEKPGPKLGDTLHALLEEVLEEPEKNTAEYLESRAKELMQLDIEKLRELGAQGRERKEETEEEAIKDIHKRHNVD
jgi:hypothetical protein